MRLDTPPLKQGQLSLLVCADTFRHLNIDHNIDARILDKDRSLFDRTGIVALSYSVAIIATTIHTQDFQDVEGDTSIGRRTLAITHPEFARLITPVLLVAWSFLSWYVWELGWLTKMGFVLLAGVAGVRIFCLRSEPHDKITYHYWYNVSSFALIFAVGN